MADETMILQVVEPADGTFRQVTWDTIEIEGYSPGPLRVKAVTGDGSEHEDTLELVDQADEILPEPMFELPRSRPMGYVRGCFEAFFEGREVLGIPWTFDVSGPVDQATIRPSMNCISFEGIELGPVDVTASVPGVSATFTVTMLPHPG